MEFLYKTSFYQDADTPDPVKLFNDAKARCFRFLQDKLDFEKTYKIKLDIIVTDYDDTDKFFQVKTLRITAKELT